MVDSEVWSSSQASWPLSESSSACRRLSCASTATMSRMLWARAKSTSTRSRLCSWARIRARVSITSPVTSSALRVEAVTLPSSARSSIAASKSVAGIRSTTLEVRTSPSVLAIVFSSAMLPP
jgi:hypothetical protein